MTRVPLSRGRVNLAKSRYEVKLAKSRYEVNLAISCCDIDRILEENQGFVVALKRPVYHYLAKETS